MPGVLYKLKLQNLISEKYIDLNSKIIDCAEQPQQQTDIEEALSISLKQHLLSDVPVGLALSGGIDSTTLASVKGAEGINYYASRLIDNDPLVNSIGMTIDDKPYIYNSDNNIEAYRDSLHKLIDLDYFLPPWGGGASQYLLCKAVRESKKKVLIGGDGVDEILLSYSWDKSALTDQSLTPSKITKIFASTNTLNLDKDEEERLSNLPPYQQKQILLMIKNLSFLSNVTLYNSDIYSMAASIELRSPFLNIDVFKSLIMYAINGSKAYIPDSQEKDFLIKIIQKKYGNYKVSKKVGTRNHSAALIKEEAGKAGSIDIFDNWNLASLVLTEKTKKEALNSSRKLFLCYCINHLLISF